MVDVSRVSEVEDATAIYAVGDIHGRLDLLDEMEAAIAADVARSRPGRPLICYLGDYVDRGPHSAQVIDRLCSTSNSNMKRVFLKGNHEDRMLDFLVAPEENGPAWMKFGGREALESYGITVPDEIDDASWTVLRDRLDVALPESHRAFLDGLHFGLRWRRYLFVHAGLDPRRPVTAQMPHDLMWIREPFLSSDCNWGFKVVHGHVIVAEPVFRANRIGIDTGAYQSECLTCLVIDDGGERLIQT